jgi:hypothetical protein
LLSLERKTTERRGVLAEAQMRLLGKARGRIPCLLDFLWLRVRIRENMVCWLVLGDPAFSGCWMIPEYGNAARQPRTSPQGEAHPTPWQIQHGMFNAFY